MQKESVPQFQDRVLVCSDCSEEFVFTAGEQEFFRDKLLADPHRCPKCREIRKASVRARAESGGGVCRDR